jgi:hypothetical protein
VAGDGRGTRSRGWSLSRRPDDRVMLKRREGHREVLEFDLLGFARDVKETAFIEERGEAYSVSRHQEAERRLERESDLGFLSTYLPISRTERIPYLLGEPTEAHAVRRSIKQLVILGILSTRCTDEFA